MSDLSNILHVLNVHTCSNAGAAESDGPLVKRKCTTADVKQPVSKATRCHRAVAKEHRVWPFVYHCVGEDWQHTICKSLGVHFKQAVKVGSGRADLPLTRPNMQTI